MAEKPGERQRVQAKYFFENKDMKPEYVNRSFFLFFDFDGTLVPIQKDPTKCVLSPGMKNQLKAISMSGKACIAILTGRIVSDIRDRVSIQDVYYGGNHGIEISGPRVNYTHPEALSGKHIIDKVCREIEKEVGHIEGALVEKKEFGFTLHYRMANKEDKALIQKAFHRIIAENSDAQRVTVIRGKKVLELAPNILWDKGKAALFLLQKQKRDFLPIYVGDDLTDETAFQALREVGMTIRIGKSKKSAAQYYLKGQWEVLRFLKHIRDLMR
jgi:trehalose-phosphatase